MGYRILYDRNRVAPEKTSPIARSVLSTLTYGNSMELQMKDHPPYGTKAYCIWMSELKKEQYRTRPEMRTDMSRIKTEYFKTHDNPMLGKHHSKEANESNALKHRKRRIPRPAPLCACGCGSYTTFNKHLGWGWNIFCAGHGMNLPGVQLRQVKKMKETLARPEIKLKRSKAVTGSLNGNWQGGIAHLPYTWEWTNALKEQVKQRDNYTCRGPACEKKTTSLDIHHIDYDKTNNKLGNLITLCDCCHGKTKCNNRTYWTHLFQNLLEAADKVFSVENRKGVSVVK